MTVITTHGAADDPGGLARELAGCDQVVSVPCEPAKVGSRAFAGALARSWLTSYPVDLWRWRPQGFRAAVADLLARHAFDVIVADFLVAEPNLPARCGAPVVLFAHNVEYRIWQRLARVESRWWRRAPLEVEWRKMRARERAALRRADATIAVSEDDAALLRELEAAARIHVVPTGVDLDYFAPVPGREVPRRLVFSGSMDWYPNEDAILFFADEVWPALRARFPDLSLTVVGRNPSASLRERVGAVGITLTGTVDDVRPYLAEAELYVVPLRVGGGTRLKIFEALAMGKPVVSTTVGAEGLGLVDGRDFVSADGADGLVDAISSLLVDEDRRRNLAAQGSRLVRERFGWEPVTAVFARALESAVRPHVAAPARVASVASA